MEEGYEMKEKTGERRGEDVGNCTHVLNDPVLRVSEMNACVAILHEREKTNTNTKEKIN